MVTNIQVTELINLFKQYWIQNADGILNGGHFLGSCRRGIEVIKVYLITAKCFV